MNQEIAGVKSAIEQLKLSAELLHMRTQSTRSPPRGTSAGSTGEPGERVTDIITRFDDAVQRLSLHNTRFEVASRPKQATRRMIKFGLL